MQPDFASFEIGLKLVSKGLDIVYHMIYTMFRFDD